MVAAKPKKQKSVPTERELKFRCDDEVAARLLVAPEISQWMQTPWQLRQIRTDYYDSVAGDFAAFGVELRLRQEGEYFCQSIKGRGSNNTLLLDRFEVETPLMAPQDFPRPLETSFSGPLDRLIAQKRPQLVRLMGSDVQRHSCIILFKEAEIEISLDLGLMEVGLPQGGCREAVLRELELELVGGEVRDFFAFAAKLARHYPLLPSYVSKAQRGRLLLAGKRLVRQKVPIMPPRRKASLKTIREAGTRRGLALVLSNLEPFVEGDARACKKIRQGLLWLNRVAPLGLAAEGGDLFSPEDISVFKQTRKSLGLARDWQIVMEEIIPAMLLSLKAEGESGAPLSGAISAAGEAYGQAMAAAHQRVQAPAFISALLAVSGRLESGAYDFAPDHKKARNQSRKQSRKQARKQARALMEKTWGTAKRRTRRLVLGRATGFHDLRRSVRRLRQYGQIFGAAAPSPWSSHPYDPLSRLQEGLGEHQDLCRARRLISDLPLAKGGDAGAAWMVGWLLARQQMGEPFLQEWAEALFIAKRIRAKWFVEGKKYAGK